MQLNLALILFGVFTVNLKHVTCLTNRDVYEFVSKYGEEVQQTALQSDDETTEYEYDAIDLSGDIDDDVDVDYLLKRLGLQSELKYGFTSGCSCSVKNVCKCCVSHRFNFYFKSFNLAACITIQYQAEGHTFTLGFTVNKHSLINKQISLDRISKLCFPIPGLGGLAKVCLGIYDVDLARLHACARLTGIVDIVIHEFKINMKLGCFTFRKSQSDLFVTLDNEHDNRRVDLLPDINEYEPRDLPIRFRKPSKATESEEDELLKFKTYD